MPSLNILHQNWNEHVFSNASFYNQLNCTAHNIRGNACGKFRVRKFCSPPPGGSSAAVPFGNPCEGEITKVVNYNACALDHHLNQILSRANVQGCKVISIGSRNQWDFEEAIVARTPCEVHTFDPMSVTEVKVPPHIENRTIFHSKFISGTSSRNNKTINYDDMLILVNASSTNPLLMLKMDCEGCEHQVFESFLSRKNYQPHLPPLVACIEIFIY